MLRQRLSKAATREAENRTRIRVTQRHRRAQSPWGEFNHAVQIPDARAALKAQAGPVHPVTGEVLNMQHR
jgi:hypothetical protein